MADNSFTSNSRIIPDESVFRIIRIVLIIVLLDLFCGIMLRKYYFRQISGVNYRTTYAMEKTSEDILVLGSSRALGHYDPRILHDALGLSCYNCGRNGMNLFYYYAVQCSILKRYKPRIMLLDIIPYALQSNPADCDKLSCLLPYYKDHEEIRPVLHLRGPLEKLKLFSFIYPFNSGLLTILKYNFSYETDFCGFVPSEKVMDTAKLSAQPEINHMGFAGTREVDARKILMLESFIRNARSAGVSVAVVLSPLYEEIDPGDKTFQRLLSLLEQHQTPLWDYSHHPSFIRHPELFADAAHLNFKGAKIFSELIAERIKTDLLNKK